MRLMMQPWSSETHVFTRMEEGTINDSREPRPEGLVAPDNGDNGAMGVMTKFAQATQLELSYSNGAGGAIVSARGELDIATADQAFAYLRDVVDRQQEPLTVNLSGLTFCDAAGLGALARLAGHARRSGHELKLTAARPGLLRIMRITRMDETFPELRSPGLHMIAWPRQAGAAD